MRALDGDKQFFLVVFCLYDAPDRTFQAIPQESQSGMSLFIEPI
jgi:hypothetical protein